jgi:putative endonuclease
MPIVARVVFGLVNWAARNGLAENAGAADSGVEIDRAAANRAAKDAARRTGVRGETYAYWYLRRHGYTIISRNYMVPGFKGELDLVGYDGQVLAFVEVKTRAYAAERTGPHALPEDAVTPEKQRKLVRMARQFLTEWRIKEAACRFDVLAIESQSGKTPRVRLHKDCFGASAGEIRNGRS